MPSFIFLPFPSSETPNKLTQHPSHHPLNLFCQTNESKPLLTGSNEAPIIVFFYIEHRYRLPGPQTKQLSPFEAAAEELMNGLLCHYEPPPNKRLMSFSERQRQEQLELRRPSSILKKTSSFDGNSKQRMKSKGRFVRFAGITFKSDESSSSKPLTGLLKKLKRRKAAF